MKVTRLRVDRDQAEERVRQRPAELQNALGKVKSLGGWLPIRPRRRRIRDDQGNWIVIETYGQERSAADFSHGPCPTCAQQLYSGFCPVAKEP